MRAIALLRVSISSFRRRSELNRYAVVLVEALISIFPQRSPELSKKTADDAVPTVMVLAGNNAASTRVHRFVLQNWRRTLSSRSQRGRVNWKRYAKILDTFPIRKPKIYVTYSDIERMASP